MVRWASLAEVLASYHGLDCADDRDRVFSLLSLDSNFGLKPDYEWTTMTPYTKFARQMTKQNIFGCMIDGLGLRSGIDPFWRTLPSWIPDLRQPFVYDPSSALKTF
ncbi:hypothetical protein K431DRAFT_28927 [Polychaeton citri CBS 116435]|uniref:Uncharacterized protein n=1 Tax=Polychaeton citri CBS 116435 TaxID=1314669 RepID=A0A9P4QA06_9PEZI|nr:hypothetical protein K431DRAFT_28927 [Polychaeton citri CBS 116435]